MQITNFSQNINKFSAGNNKQNGREPSFKAKIDHVKPFGDHTPPELADALQTHLLEPLKQLADDSVSILIGHSPSTKNYANNKRLLQVSVCKSEQHLPDAVKLPNIPGAKIREAKHQFVEAGSDEHYTEYMLNEELANSQTHGNELPILTYVKSLVKAVEEGWANRKRG